MKTTFDAYVKRNCYSYTRFSSSQQAEGDSYRRQAQKTVDFCKTHNLELNETRYEDLGVSGWTGANIEKGALGDFIAAVKAGKIPKGSVLIVENWDRFSRLKPMDAYNKVGEIVKAGVDVVTLADEKFHTAEMYANENGGKAVGFSTFPINSMPGVTPLNPMDWRTVLPAIATWISP